MYVMIFCTCPDQDSAERIAHHLVANRLVACVNLLPGVRSIYRWQDQIEQAQEHLLLIKTQKTSFERVQQAIEQMHPYEVPEIIAVPIEQGAERYLKWIDSCVTNHC